MPLNQHSIREILNRKMEPGLLYYIRELIVLIENNHNEFTGADMEPNPSEPFRPRWHRLVTNSVRMSLGRSDYSDNSWTNLRTIKQTKDYQYSIAAIDFAEQEIVKNRSSDDGSGMVYAIQNPAWCNWIKIGKTIDIDARLNSYQTYSPLKDFRVLFKRQVVNRHLGESLAHHEAIKHANQSYSGEWFSLSTAVAKSIISKIDA